MNKKILQTAIASVLGVSSVTLTTTASAMVTTFSWSGVSTWIDPQGAILYNTSNIIKGSNGYQTAITGVLAFDDTTGAGSGYVDSYDWWSGTSPAEAVEMHTKAIGDGAGGTGSLMIANILLNWNGVNGIPVSMVWDAAGFLGASSADWSDNVLTQSEVAGFGATPASDGTYTDPIWSYLNQGPVPIATTEFNTTNLGGCTFAADTNYTNNTGGGCMGEAYSGGLPLVTDTAVNTAQYAQGDGVGVAGSPMQDGPFQGFSYTYDIKSMTIVSVDGNGEIPSLLCEPPGSDIVVPNCIGYPSSVPVPAAVWLFGSGLLALIGIGRKKTHRDMSSSWS